MKFGNMRNDLNIINKILKLIQNNDSSLSNLYYPKLDGVRGIAILIVICYHYFPTVSLFRFGWSGVDLFFVLSGFLITSRLIPFINNKQLLSNFYRNRALRILPLYFTFLCCFFCIWFLFVSKHEQQSTIVYNKYWYIFFLFGENWLWILNKNIDRKSVV